MIIAIIPFIIAVLGALLYAFSNPATNPKAMEIGRLMFFCGLLVLTFAFAHEVLHIG